jgi:hypothetical protein
MPHFVVEFEDGQRYGLTAGNKKAAKAKAQQRYRRKMGKPGQVKSVR